MSRETRTWIGSSVLAVGLSLALNFGGQVLGAEPTLVERIKAIPGLGEGSFSLVVRVKVKPEAVATMIAASKKAAKASQAEKGCRRYEFQQDAEDETLFYLFETWDNFAALEAHFAEPHFKEFVEVFPPLTSEPATVRLTRRIE